MTETVNPPSGMGAPQRRWFDRLTSQLWRRILFALICAAPFLTGLFGRLSRQDHVFSDYEAIACAGERAGQGLAIYGGDLSCTGMEPYPFVYLPWIADGHAAASAAIGPLAVEIIYAGLFIAAALFIAWLILFKIMMPGDIWDRLPALGLVTGGTVYSGNIAIILHAMICAAALRVSRMPWLFAIAVAVAAAIKPTFLTYGLVLLVIPIPVWQRLLWGGLAAIGGLAPTLVFLTSGADASGGWTQTLQTMMFEAAPGVTFVGWLNLFGIVGLSPAAIAGWLALVVVLVSATLAISIAGKLAANHRIWLAIGVAALANPRLMEYDAPFLLCLLGSIIVVARHNVADRALSRRMVGALAGFGVLAALGNSLDAGDYTSPLFTFVMCAGLAVLAVIFLRGGAREEPALTPETKEGGPSGPPSL